MQTIDKPQEQDFVTSFALQRQRLLHHVGGLLDGSAGKALTDQAAITQLSQTLLSSFELLKVAEEELRDERRTNSLLQAAQDKRVGHLEAMFDLAPAGLLLTAPDTTIRECNRAAGRFLGREPYHLVGSQLLEMIPRAEQRGFREQVTHLLEVGGTADWSFTLELHRTAPVVARCAVALITEVAVGARALYWSIGPASA
jgi:PAS domain S-box-containing protein